MCSSWNSPYSALPLVILKRFSRFCVVFWMSSALCFIAPMSWSIPNSFQHVATAPLTVSWSTEIFSSLPDSRSKIATMTHIRNSTNAVRDSITKITYRSLLVLNSEIVLTIYELSFYI